jgi:hypothetical protein
MCICPVLLPFEFCPASEEMKSWTDQIASTVATLVSEKEATRRRQRVLKARSRATATHKADHARRTELHALIQDNLMVLPGANGEKLFKPEEESQFLSPPSAKV